MTDVDLFEPTTPANLGAAPPRKCSHPRQFREDVRGELAGIAIHVQKCGRCGKSLDPAAQRAGRRNRKRGGAAELTVAKAAGGRKMGPLGLPWDVEVAGVARIQVRKYADPQSLRKIGVELDRIAVAPGPESPVYVWIPAGASVRDGLVIERLPDWIDRTGIKVTE